MRYIGFMDKKIIKKINRRSLSEKIYDQLKEAIVDLTFKPGERLNDAALAGQFGVSRTPVREAFKRLEDEGLIELFPGSMTRVANLDEESARHAFTVVAALHALAARLAVPVLKKDSFARMKNANEQLEKALENRDDVQAIQADAEFHQVMLEAAANPEILYALERMTPKICRLERARFISSGAFDSVRQHQDIIQAAQKKKSGKTAGLVEKNWLTLGQWVTR